MNVLETRLCMETDFLDQVKCVRAEFKSRKDLLYELNISDQYCGVCSSPVCFCDGNWACVPVIPLISGRFVYPVKQQFRHTSTIESAQFAAEPAQVLACKIVDLSLIKPLTPIVVRLFNPNNILLMVDIDIIKTLSLFCISVWSYLISLLHLRKFRLVLGNLHSHI